MDSRRIRDSAAEFRFRAYVSRILLFKKIVFFFAKYRRHKTSTVSDFRSFKLFLYAII